MLLNRWIVRVMLLSIVNASDNVCSLSQWRERERCMFLEVRKLHNTCLHVCICSSRNVVVEKGMLFLYVTGPVKSKG